MEAVKYSPYMAFLINNKHETTLRIDKKIAENPQILRSVHEKFQNYIFRSRMIW